MIYTIVKNHSTKSKINSRTVNIRDYKNFDPVSFNNHIMDCNLTYAVDSFSNVEDAWQIWSAKVLQVMNKHAPLKSHRVKARHNPWITRDILLAMYQRDNIHKRAVKSGDQTLYAEYRSSRNRVVNCQNDTQS